MKYLKKITDWLYNNSSSDDEEEEIKAEHSESKETIEAEDIVKEYKIKTVQKMLTRLYIIEQKIIVIKEDFEEDYFEFKRRIEELEKEYVEALENSKKDLTFEINPEEDGKKLAKILSLEEDVNVFMERKVKFNIIIRKLQKLVLKANILYNVSVVHTKQNEKEKVIKQTERASYVEKKLLFEFRKNENLINNDEIKDEFTKLITYLDYEIFKLLVRNSTFNPRDVIKKLAIAVEFDKYDYKTVFIAFIEEELSNLKKLAEKIENTDIKKVLMKKSNEVLAQIISADEEILLDQDFWEDIFDLETNVFEILKEEGIDKNNIKIKIVTKIEISVTEDEVLSMPVTNAYIALTDVCYEEKNEKILLVMKILKNISSDITYREIYFLLVLFECIDSFKNRPNDFGVEMKKYYEKYPYSNKQIKEKKDSVRYLINKEYVYAFSIKQYESNILEELEKLNMDFINKENKIFLNKFYFSGLTTVINSLEKATKIN